MSKILIVNTVPFEMSGMSSVIMNYINNMNKENLDISVVVNSKIEKNYKDQLEKNGIKVIILKRNKKVINYMLLLYKEMKKEKFDAVHIHGNSSTMAFETIPAYLSKIPVRIVHSHNVSCKYKILNKILWPILNRTYTLPLACSNEAGKWLFKEQKEFLVLNNAINLEKYEFNMVARNQVRKELGIDNRYVIGHVGYFNEQKNHEKLFQIVSHLKNKQDVVLLCVSGDTDIPENINEMVIKYKLQNNIKILLRRNDVNKVLQAMDFFVFPSKFEGLGLALIEAQATGIPCLASTGVPKSAGICNELVSYLDLTKDANTWANLILAIKEREVKSRTVNSIYAIKQLKKAGYDINIEAEKLKQIYMG